MWTPPPNGTPGTGDANAPGYLFGGSKKADGFNLNVIKLVLERDADLSDGWGAGYKVDLLFGPDANTHGTLSSNATGGSADFAVKQAYVDLKAPFYNGLEFKVGVWDTILGYEVFETPLNPNFTRSYAYGIEPSHFHGGAGDLQFHRAGSVPRRALRTPLLRPSTAAPIRRALNRIKHSWVISRGLLPAPGDGLPAQLCLARWSTVLRRWRRRPDSIPPIKQVSTWARPFRLRSSR